MKVPLTLVQMLCDTQLGFTVVFSYSACFYKAGQSRLQVILSWGLEKDQQLRVQYMGKQLLKRGGLEEEDGLKRKGREVKTWGRT